VLSRSYKADPRQNAIIAILTFLITMIISPPLHLGRMKRAALIQRSTDKYHAVPALQMWQIVTVERDEGIWAVHDPFSAGNTGDTRRKNYLIDMRILLPQLRG
jgi:hypothetical protein